MHILDNGVLRDATPEEVVEYEARQAAPLPVPATVTRRQARQALLLEGLLDLVPEKLAAIPNLTHRALATIEWEDSQVFERNRPLVISIGTALGLDSDGLDELFRKAGAL